MYQNEQLWNECCLISVWNAARFYGLKAPDINSKEYKRLCVKYKCIKDGCSDKDIRREAKRLGMYMVEGDWNLKWIRENLPIEITVVIKKDYYHCVLIVDVHGYKLKLANYYKGRCKWILWSDLKKRIIDKQTKDYHRSPYSFKLGL